jgi:hypothetical protein
VTYRNHGPVDLEDGEAGVPDPVVVSLLSEPADVAVLLRSAYRNRHGDKGPSMRWLARQVARAADDWNDSAPSDRRGFAVSNGRLMHAVGDAETTAVGATYAATLAAYDPAAAGGADWAAGAQPKRALTVAIVVEGQGNSVEISVPLARLLVEEVLGDALVDGW